MSIIQSKRQADYAELVNLCIELGWPRMIILSADDWGKLLPFINPILDENEKWQYVVIGPTIIRPKTIWTSVELDKEQVFE